MTVGVELSELVTAGLVSVVVEHRRIPVRAIHFHGESGPPRQGALIAAAGVIVPSQQSDAVELAAAAGASVIVFQDLSSPEIQAQCRELGIALAVLGAGVDWSHLVWFLRSMLDRGKVVVGSELPAQQGLFAMADAVAAMLDAPVTIEDAHSRVVAYSATTDGADDARTSTIMTRAVPAAVLRRLRASGALKRLTHDSRPFVVPALEPGFLQRLVIPLRIGGQAIGSIWAIWDGDLDAQLEAQLTATGTAAALSLVQLNANVDLAGRYSQEAIRAALRDGTTETLGVLDLPSHPIRVVALQRISSTSPADDVSVWRTFFRKKSWSDPLLSDVDGHVLAIVPERSGPGGWTWLRDLAHAGAPGRIASSRPRSESAELPAARREATETLAAAAALGYPVADFEEVWDAVVLRRASAAVSTVDHQQLRRLRFDDRPSIQPLASTLCAWLECGGDIKETAAALHLHPNTVRHRLKKIDELVGSALRTNTQRLAALLLLRGWDESRPGNAPPGA